MSTPSWSMPDRLYDRVLFSRLDEAIDRLRAFAKAHNDFEPSLECERDRSGRRRWALSVVRRPAQDRRHHEEPDE